MVSEGRSRIDDLALRRLLNRLAFLSAPPRHDRSRSITCCLLRTCNAGPVHRHSANRHSEKRHSVKRSDNNRRRFIVPWFAYTLRSCCCRQHSSCCPTHDQQRSSCIVIYALGYYILKLHLAIKTSSSHTRTISPANSGHYSNVIV